MLRREEKPSNLLRECVGDKRIAPRTGDGGESVRYWCALDILEGSPPHLLREDAGLTNHPADRGWRGRLFVIGVRRIPSKEAPRIFYGKMRGANEPSCGQRTAGKASVMNACRRLSTGTTGLPCAFRARGGEARRVRGHFGGSRCRHRRFPRRIPRRGR